MPPKRVLIVDDEEAILIVLKNSLKKLGPDYEVSTAPDGMTALQLMQHGEFDMLVTDYRMVGMNGLELISAARAYKPDIQVILMTAYGSSSLEAELRPHQPYQYLNKPLEIEAFRQVIKESLEMERKDKIAIMVFSDATYHQLHDLLSQLRTDVNARCIFLTNAEGHLVAQVGDSRDLPLEQIASLLGGGISALFEAGRVFDNSHETINFTFREGKHENLYAINVGSDWLLTVITETGLYSSKLGSVWYYTRQVAITLIDMLSEANQVKVSFSPDNNLEGAIDQEFDQLFGQLESHKEPREAQRADIEVNAEQLENLVQKYQPSQPMEHVEPTPREETSEPDVEKEPLLTFEEALKAGLLQWPSLDGSIL